MANKHKRDIIMIFYETICHRVRPQDITIELKNKGIVSDTNSLIPIKQMESIISNIDKSNVPGKWAAFEDALRQQGYENICKMINGDEWQADHEDEQKISRLTDGIKQKLNLSVELLADLKTKKLINERCYEEIKAIRTKKLKAAEMVLDNIHRFKYGWYRIFLDILIENKQKDLANEIEPDYGDLKTVTANDGDLKTVTANDATEESKPEIMKEEELFTIAADDEKKNCIIYILAKRHILAENIINRHMERDKKHKVMIVAPQYSVELHHKLLKKSYSASILENDITEELKKNQVVLFIPETLKKANVKKFLTHFSLLIIDECHLIIKDYPYDNLMTNYIHARMDNCRDPLPQVVGMTTLLSHQIPRNTFQADLRIQKLCGNMDCEKIYIYQDGISYYSFQTKEVLFSEEEFKENPLKEKVNEVMCKIENDPKNSDEVLFSEEEFKENPLKEKVNEVMCKIENDLKNSDVAAKIKKEKPTLFEILNADNNKRDGHSYVKWLAVFKDGFASLTDFEDHKFCNCHWLILNILHTALEIGTYCEIKPAFEYIEVEYTREGHGDKIYADLFKYWDEVKPEIKTIIDEERYQNPLLKKVKNYIIEEIEENEFSRIVVFVKATILVKNIVMWMVNDKELLPLLPMAVQEAKVFGAQMSAEMIRAFNYRECQLCVATLEESCLIADNYNLRLDYYDKEDATMKGKFRGNTLQKEVDDGNSNPELFLHDAMKKINNYTDTENNIHLEEIRKNQRIEKNQLKKEKEDSEENFTVNKGEFSMHCKHCNEFACISTDIRFQGEMYFACIPRFIKKVNVRNESDQVARCKSCCKEWGKINRESDFLLELKISSFNIVDITKNTFNVEKWEFVPFFKYIKEVTQKELKKMSHK